LAAFGRSGDKKLTDYDQYWRGLVPELHACRHDVVVLSGDSHHGLIAHTELGTADNRHQLVQVVSSPLSLVSPIAASIPERRPHAFPAATPGAEPHPIRYPLLVPTYRSGPVERSEEHGMTIALWRRDERSLGLRVRTWLARAATQHREQYWETTLRSG
ncbi:MAG TPA: hypothetical protein VK524_23265, partial [Polyangiaceae bacterium]|nr:hypothetical protein [Polyangiaceae bacterium]